jgi:hypothetical protein
MEYFDNMEFYRLQYMIEKMVEYKKQYETDLEL